ncbi:hypothetical protein Hanom_Chr03g00251251 [Helianthus anomalus]
MKAQRRTFSPWLSPGYRVPCSMSPSWSSLVWILVNSNIFANLFVVEVSVGLIRWVEGEKYDEIDRKNLIKNLVVESRERVNESGHVGGGWWISIGLNFFDTDFRCENICVNYLYL